jgi:hypothetical protein
MTFKRSFTSALALIGAVTLFAPGIVRADQFDKKIIVGFNKPVEIPTRVLKPGTYVFKLADHGNIPNVVQVFNRDESQIYATLFTIPKYRADVTDQPVFQFEERNPGEPMSIHAWFYPGEGTGYEFLYSKDSRVQPEAEPAVSVTPDNTEAAPAPPEPPVPPTQIVTIERVRIIEFLEVPEEPRPDPTAAFEPVVSTTKEQPKELPKTASGLPLLALFGMLSLGGAAILQAAGRLSAYLARK